MLTIVQMEMRHDILHKYAQVCKKYENVCSSMQWYTKVQNRITRRYMEKTRKVFLKVQGMWLDSKAKVLFNHYACTENVPKKVAQKYR